VRTALAAMSFFIGNRIVPTSVSSVAAICSPLTGVGLHLREQCRAHLRG